ncbi:MAG: hypothetical protein IH989_00845, partial [Planctomycetes bacterium]|nr:hypothetical protein [Planctomycetota bacterium]
MGRSRTSDISGHLWIEQGEPQEGTIAEVAPLIPTNRTYSFAVPEVMEGSLGVGQRVMVPLGRRARLVEGFVVGLDRRAWDSTLQPIRSLADPYSCLTPELIELGRQIAAHYACPLGRTLKAITPEAVRRQRGLTTVRYARLKRSPDEIRESGVRLSRQRQALIDVLAVSRDLVPVKRLLAASGASQATLRAL